MDQVKRDSKTIILDLFQASSAKKCRPNKGLDSPTPRPSTNDPNYATSSSKIGESHYLCSDEKLSDNCPVGQKKIEKMKFNPQWLQKYSLVAIQAMIC